LTFTQDFVTSRNNIADGDTRIGQKDRLWYDPITKTIRVSDGITPGGILIAGGGNTFGANLDGGVPNSIYGGTTAIDAGGVN
jgi:hypothetical protein